MKRIRYLLIAAVALMCTAATAQKTIAERQYWIDGNITDAQTLAESPTSIGIGNLKLAGGQIFHCAVCFHQRYQ